jgi:hypothetical protein
MYIRGILCKASSADKNAELLIFWRDMLEDGRSRAVQRTRARDNMPSHAKAFMSIAQTEKSLKIDEQN